MKGYRKLIVALVAILCAFVLALRGQLSGEFATIVSVAVGVFAAANAVEHRGEGHVLPRPGKDQTP